MFSDRARDGVSWARQRAAGSCPLASLGGRKRNASSFMCIVEQRFRWLSRKLYVTFLFAY